MSSLLHEKSTLENKQKLALPISHVRVWEFLGIAIVGVIAAWLRFSNLDSLGYVNHYYTAGIESMLKSWHNFFFVAAEPGGSVSLDKPPLGFWLQAISAYFLGVNGFSVLLPQLIAGVISVVVLYHLVRRSFGVVPGLVAALALAITPVVVATDRNNTIDSTLILTLLLAAWAFIKATETGKLRHLLLGAALVGIGFNIKMLEAYLPLPAFYALYFFGSREKIGPKAGKLVLASALLAVISFSWVTIVDLTPATQRPYVGSSSDNSETNLILVYNGVDRLMGMFGRGRNNRPGGFTRPAGQGPLPQPDGPFANGQDGSNNNPFFQRRFNGNNFPPPGGFVGPNGNRTPFNNFRGPAGNGGGGGFNIGRAGPLRLFIPPLSKETSWLLPFGIISMLLLAVSRWHWPFTPKHQALVLWGGWLITCAVFFSIAGFFHEYYLSMMAPPLAALVAIGIGQLWDLAGERRWLTISILGVSATITLAFQSYTAATFIQTATSSFVRNMGWLPLAIGLFAIGLVLLVLPVIRQSSRFVLGFALVSAAIFVTPGAWSVLTNLSASQNQSLPSAYSGGRIGPVEQRGLRIDQALLNYLQDNTKNTKYLMAVPSSMQGADYVLATGRPVLYMGGFMGQDKVVSAEDLKRLIINGELRYIYWNAVGMGAKSEITSWVTSSCTPVKGFDVSTQNAGAPDGTLPNSNPNNRFASTLGRFPGDMLVSLYDCANQPATR